MVWKSDWWKYFVVLLILGCQQKVVERSLPDLVPVDVAVTDEPVTEEFLSAFWRALKRHMPNGLDFAMLRQLMR